MYLCQNFSLTKLKKLVIIDGKAKLIFIQFGISIKIT